MSVLLYAIADGAHPDPSDIPGVTGAPLHAIRADEVAAIVGETPVRLGESLDQLRAFAAVIDRLAAAGTVLPARFGTVLADPAAVRAELTRQAGSYSQRLARVRGAVEFGLRARETDGASASTGESGESGAGTAYLLAKMAERRRDGELAAAIEAAVGPLIRDRVERRDPRHGLAIACLVDADQVDPFLARVDALRAALAPATELTCTGPWPPFSFSAEEAA